jgi:hypothetical protein
MFHVAQRSTRARAEKTNPRNRIRETEIQKTIKQVRVGTLGVQGNFGYGNDMYSGMAELRTGLRNE